MVGYLYLQFPFLFLFQPPAPRANLFLLNSKKIADFSLFYTLVQYSRIPPGKFPCGDLFYVLMRFCHFLLAACVFAQDGPYAKTNLANSMRLKRQRERAKLEGRERTLDAPYAVAPFSVHCLASIPLTNDPRHPPHSAFDDENGMPYQRFELTPAGRAAVPDDPRTNYWMMAYATLKERKRIARPEAGLSADEVRVLLRSDDKAVAAATGELCLASRLPNVPKMARARAASNPPTKSTGSAFEQARLCRALHLAIARCVAGRRRWRSLRSS